MDLKEYFKQLPLRIKIELKIYSFWDGLMRKIGLCSHDSTFGEVGEKYHMCICGKEVFNEDWEQEKEILEYLKFKS